MNKEDIIYDFVGSNFERSKNAALLTGLYDRLVTPEIVASKDGLTVVAKHLVSGYFLTFDLESGTGPHIESADDLMRISKEWRERKVAPRKRKKNAKRNVSHR